VKGRHQLAESSTLDRAAAIRPGRRYPLDEETADLARDDAIWHVRVDSLILLSPRRKGIHHLHIRPD
jgi:hypothetical protein